MVYVQYNFIWIFKKDIHSYSQKFSGNNREENTHQGTGLKHQGAKETFCHVSFILSHLFHVHFLRYKTNTFQKVTSIEPWENSEEKKDRVYQG